MKILCVNILCQRNSYSWPISGLNNVNVFLFLLLFTFPSVLCKFHYNKICSLFKVSIVVCHLLGKFQKFYLESYQSLFAHSILSLLKRCLRFIPKLHTDNIALQTLVESVITMEFFSQILDVS